MKFDFNALQSIADTITEDILIEEELQGHEFSGELQNTLEAVVSQRDNSIYFTITGPDYLEELEVGVKAGDMKDRANFVYESLLTPKFIQWVEEKFSADINNRNSPIQIAKFIIANWKFQGKPLPGAEHFSRTGEVLHAVEIAINRNYQKTEVALTLEVGKIVDNEIKARMGIKQY